jgi:hypothetical protein
MPETRDRESFERSGGNAGRDFSALGNEMRTQARETASAAVGTTLEFAERQKAAGADNVARLGRAVHGAAEQLGDELPQAAGYIHSAADTLQNASSALRERSAEDLVSDFLGFARRQPAAAFAGAMLAGFALSRFIKSSHPSGQD